MRLSVSWLREWVDVPADARVLEDALTGALRFDIPLLASRLGEVTEYVAERPETRALPRGYANAAANTLHAQTCWRRPQRTGCGTRPARTWSTIRSICDMCATTSGMRR